jgi:hypothetical protein
MAMMFSFERVRRYDYDALKRIMPTDQLVGLDRSRLT